ncbi:hypothetical protein ZIOFF_013315 [Zingiber officinale]|uniref:UBN2_2 domain-containing protein n=1 Tax=Zingiber officinale TaxID=94328 RepID=A0A8J5LKT0_ZINOF|nr:hypothetical protein ZIOFF_013315 [Zingiber officinale]
MDLDLALRVDEPQHPTKSSNAGEKASYERWERSNRLSLMLIKSHFVKSDKALASTPMKRLLGMKYGHAKGVREHIMEMRGDIATQLKSLEIEISEPFLVH